MISVRVLTSSGVGLGGAILHSIYAQSHSVGPDWACSLQQGTSEESSC